MQFVRALYRIRKVIGISCTYTAAGAQYSICCLRQQGEKVDIVEHRHFERIDDVMTYCGQHADHSVSLHIQGKGILLKQVDNALGNAWDERYLYDVFPNFSPDHYYYTVMHGEGLFWISIVQQQRVDELLTDFAQQAIPIVQLFVGPFVLSAILPQINLYEQHYIFAGHAIRTTEEGEWVNYSYDEVQNQAKFSLKVADRPIQQMDIEAYATAFNTLLYGYVEDYALPVSQTRHNLEESMAKIRFKNNGLLLLGMTFLLLLVSMGMYQYYYQHNEQLRLSTMRQQDNVQDTEKRIQSMAKKEQLLVDLGWNGGVPKAWLLDQIALSLHAHKGIALTDVQINPAPERRRGGTATQQIVDNRQKIRLQGHCVSLDGLNAWVRQLSNLGWVQRVQITRFTPSELYGDDSQVFTLDMTYSYAF